MSFFTLITQLYINSTPSFQIPSLLPRIKQLTNVSLALISNTMPAINTNRLNKEARFNKSNVFIVRLVVPEIPGKAVNRFRL